MPDQILTAIISAIVAILAAGSTGYFSWRKTRQENTRLLHEIKSERIKWITELKSNYTLELFKARLDTYPRLLEILREMSAPERVDEPLTPDKAKQIGKKINAWFYSTGGLCATQHTRAPLLKIRDICIEWKEGPSPKELYELKDKVELYLRRDLDVKGLESYDDTNLQSLPEELMSEIESIK